MKNLVTFALTLLTMTMLSSGTVSAAASQAPDQATVSTTASSTALERKDQRTQAKRNAAAKKLKADLDKQNAAKSNQAK
jgi:hypothetical protein